MHTAQLIYLWDVANHERSLTIKDHKHTVCKLAFTNDGLCPPVVRQYQTCRGTETRLTIRDDRICVKTIDTQVILHIDIPF